MASRRVKAIRRPDWDLALPGLSLLTVFITLLPGQTQQWLRYERSLIESGELWRLLTAHLTHLNWSHLLLNLLTLWLIRLLFPRSPTLQPISFLWLALATSCGLFVLNPDLQWYLGLSGVLHGYLAWVALHLLRHAQSGGGLLAALLLGKLGWEQLLGPMPGSEAMISANVVVDAHLYGSIAGALLWAAQPKTIE